MMQQRNADFYRLMGYPILDPEFDEDFYLESVRWRLNCGALIIGTVDVCGIKAPPLKTVETVEILPEVQAEIDSAIRAAQRERSKHQKIEAKRELRERQRLAARERQERRRIALEEQRRKKRARQELAKKRKEKARWLLRLKRYCAAPKAHRAPKVSLERIRELLLVIAVTPGETRRFADGVLAAMNTYAIHPKTVRFLHKSGVIP